jgi:hypothetical protein
MYVLPAKISHENLFFFHNRLVQLFESVLFYVAFRVTHIVISELNTLTPLLCKALKVAVKWVLSVADKLHIIKKLDAQLHVTLITLAEELSKPVLTLKNMMVNKTNIVQQGGSSDLVEPTIFDYCKMFSRLRSSYSQVPWKNLLSRDHCIKFHSSERFIFV